jgi:hypothetical protein
MKFSMGFLGKFYEIPWNSMEFHTIFNGIPGNFQWNSMELSIKFSWNFSLNSMENSMNSRNDFRQGGNFFSLRVGYCNTPTDTKA